MTNNKLLLKLSPTIPLLFTIFALTSAQQAPGSSSTQSPSDISPDPCQDSGFTDCTKCACPAFPSTFSVWMLATAALAATLSFIFLTFFLLIKQLREKPGDLAFGSIFAQIIFSISFIVEKIQFHRIHNGVVEQTEADGACISFGLVKTASNILLNFYMLSFFGVYVLSLKNYLKMNRIRSRYVNFAGLLVIVVISVGLVSWGAIGPIPDGTCGMMLAPGVLGPVAGYAAMTVAGLYLIYLIRKNLSERESLNPFQYDFVKHYMFYLIILSGLFFVITVVSIVSMIRTSPGAAENDRIHVFSFIQFILMNLCTTVLIIARLRDPLVSEHIKTSLKKWFCWWDREHYREREQQLAWEEDLYSRPTQDELRLDMERGLISNDGLVQGAHGAFERLDADGFERSKKTEMICSMLVSMACFWKMNHQDGLKKDSEEEPKDELEEILKGRGSGNQNMKKISLRDSTIKKYVPQALREIKRKNKKLVTGMFTAYGTETLQELIQKDELSIDLKESWNFVANYGNVTSYGYQVDEYGKMFLISSNGKYVLQEVSTQERRNLVQALPQYKDFLKGNPDSLLAKIYGVFSFEVDNLSRQVSMIVMKNIGECTWPGMERLYKLRSPLGASEAKKDISKASSFRPLTEQDFEAYQGKLVLDDLSKGSFMEIVNKDVEFLELYQMGNYALQVSMINKKKTFKEVVSTSVIIEVEESMDVNGSIGLMRDADLMVNSNKEIMELKEDVSEGDVEDDKEEQTVTHVGIVDFWRESKGKRTNFAWQTLRAMRTSKPEEKNKTVEKPGKAFLDYVEGILA